MQDKKDTFGTFLARTDALAEKLRINVEDLTKVLDVSRSSLFGWRKGRRSVSNKALAKLEAAEAEAGIIMEEEKLDELTEPVGVEARLARIETLLEALLEKKLNQSISSKDHGKKFS